MKFSIYLNRRVFVMIISVNIKWSTAKKKTIIIPVSVRELDCIPVKLSAISSSEDRNLHTSCCTPILGS